MKSSNNVILNIDGIDLEWVIDASIIGKTKKN